MTAALGELDRLWTEIAADGYGAEDAAGRIRAREAAAIPAVGRWIYRSALARTESRGMSRREDQTIAQFDNDAGVVAEDPSIRSLSDLAGKRIGVPKARLIDLYPADQEGPLNSSEIDGAALPGVIPSVSLQTFQRKGFHLVDSVYRDHPDLAGTNVTAAVTSSSRDTPTSGLPGRGCTPTRYGTRRATGRTTCA